MPDIFHDFPVSASSERVFQVVSTPRGLDAWWTQRSAGEPREGAEFELWFGPRYDWRAKVTRCVPHAEFELQVTRADTEWIDSRVGFRLACDQARTQVRFHHTGWPSLNEHYRVSCFCWAMYLRILRRYLEHGELVPYEQRLDV